MFVGGDVLDGVGDVPVDAIAQSLFPLAGPGFEEQVGAVFGILLVLFEARDLSDPADPSGPISASSIAF